MLRQLCHSVPILLLSRTNLFYVCTCTEWHSSFRGASSFLFTSRVGPRGNHKRLYQYELLIRLFLTSMKPDYVFIYLWKWENWNLEQIKAWTAAVHRLTCLSQCGKVQWSYRVVGQKKRGFLYKCHHHYHSFCTANNHKIFLFLLLLASMWILLPRDLCRQGSCSMSNPSRTD